jgi:iron-sulfur cluster insertion protein
MVNRAITLTDSRNLCDTWRTGRWLPQEEAHVLTLTAQAGEKLRTILETEAEPGQGLRVEVIPGGCSGFEYNLSFAAKADTDEVIESEGVEIYVDRFSAPYLFGAQFDYEDGFQGAGFVINNPNASSSCGCGKSFQA